MTCEFIWLFNHSYPHWYSHALQATYSKGMQKVGTQASRSAQIFKASNPCSPANPQCHSVSKRTTFSPHGCHRDLPWLWMVYTTQKKWWCWGWLMIRALYTLFLVVNCTGSIPDWQTLAKCWLQLIKSESNFQWFWGQQLWKEANRSNSMREQCVSRPLFILFQTMATSAHLQLLAIQLRVLTQCPPTEAECNRWTARVYYANRLSMAKSSKLANR